MPDYLTEHLWYDYGWEGNPKGPNVWIEDADSDDRGLNNEIGPVTQDAALKAWIEAYSKWSAIFDEAFDRKLAAHDYHAAIIPDQRKREAWGVQGMLLAVWLSLLPNVVAVKYTPGLPTAVFDPRAEDDDSISSTMGRLLGDMNNFMTGEHDMFSRLGIITGGHYT